MSVRQARQLERKKFLADPWLLPVIILLLVFLALFILYPLSMLMADSVYTGKAYTLYTVEESIEEVRLLASGQQREMSVSRQPVILVSSLEGVQVIRELGRAASTTYMADLLPQQCLSTALSVLEVFVSQVLRE